MLLDANRPAIHAAERLSTPQVAARCGTEQQAINPTQDSGGLGLTTRPTRANNSCNAHATNA
eukprot:1363589-Lingulodinium_polyedra.AAC.1